MQVGSDVMNTPNYKEARKRTKEKVAIRDFEIDNQLREVGLGKKFFIKTYGCQMNEHDSENIKGMLQLMNFQETFDLNEADLVILNTCSIRENAHNKAFGMLERLKHLKNEKKDLIIALCGCMAQEEGVVALIKKKYKYVNFVFGTHNLEDLPRLLKNCFNDRKLNIEVKSIEGDIVENIPVSRASKYKAYVNIIYGCDKFCTYCILPYKKVTRK